MFQTLTEADDSCCIISTGHCKRNCNPFKTLEEIKHVPPRMSEYSEYEELRISNISRNEEFLRSLGLHDSNSSRSYSLTDSRHDSRCRKSSITKSNQCRKSSKSLQVLVTRRSKRIMPKNNDDRDDNNFIELSHKNTAIQTAVMPKQSRIVDSSLSDGCNTQIYCTDEMCDHTRIKINRDSLRLFIDNLNAEHSSKISDEQLSHCIMRIQSLSNKRLGTRVKMIARAAGKSSNEKLLVFYYALRASGLDCLSVSAAAVLRDKGQVV